MSGAATSAGTPAASTAAAPSADPSMEDILASIRRILSEDEAAPEAAKPDEPAAPEEEADDVLLLDPSMLVSDEADAQAVRPPTIDEIMDAPATPAMPELVPTPIAAVALPPAALPDALPAFETLISPEPAAAAASSVDSLVRTLSNDRFTMVTSQGPTIEDIVRQEIRPLLKAWLDVNLPPLVDRLVRTEIERVVGRAAT